MKYEKEWPRWTPLAVCALIACALCFILAVEVLPVAKPVHAAFGWTVDSIYWVWIVDSVRTDSSDKLYSVTEWPDTNFDLTYGSVHQIRFIYWPPGLDSANWQFDFDMYDYNNANCVGGGSYVAAFVVYDTANDEAVQNAKVTIKQDSALGVTETWWMTDANGYLEFALDNGDFSAVTSKPRFMSSPLDFTIASANYSDTIFGYQVGTPTPPSPDYATVEGYVYSPSGERFFGAIVTATRVKGEFASDTTGTPFIVGQKPVIATIDTAGYFSMPLLRTSAYDDTTTGFYNIVGNMGTGPAIFTVIELWIPASGDVDLGLIVGRR